jgi:hypothetical protein
MVKVIIMSILVMSLNVQAKDFWFDQISTVPDFEINFLLDNSIHSKYRANLDCQSFNKKLDFYTNSGQLLKEYYITMNECEYIYLQTLTCFDKNKPKCLNTNNLLKSGCDC